MKKIYLYIKYYFLTFLNIIKIKGKLKNYPDWGKLLRSKFEKKEFKDKKKILIATSTGGHKIALTTEMIFGFSLDLKGADVEFLLCDQSLSACSQCTHAQYESEDEFNIIKAKKNCSSCWSIGNAYMKRSKFKINKFSDFIEQKDFDRIDKILDETEISKIKNFKIDNISVGEHAYSGVLRYFARGQIPNTINSKKIYVEYFKSALITYFMSVKLFSKKKYDKILLNHGIYTPQGIICDVANKFNVKVVTWYTSYRKKTVTLSHKGTYHKTLLNDEYTDWENIKLDKNKLLKLDQYLSSRRHGGNDWIYFQGKNQNFDIENYLKENKINTKRKIVSIFTNVIWDAQLYYEQNIFNDIIEWCNETINFLKDKDVTVLLRIHPAELSGSLPSNQKIYNEIMNRFQKLPTNINIIQPDNTLNSYSIIDKSSLCIVYASTIANEIAAMGKPLIIGGEAYIKNKGITYDPKSKKEYFQFIDELLKKPEIDETIKIRAKKYAYYFYFQRMIPIDLIDITEGKISDFMIDFKKVKKMIKGDYFDKGLDIICDGILNGKEFIYIDEK
tara:strand:- start:42 stop:1718 length:1677 start_codon:yes stop_codon:yes gene_type:complete